MKGVKMNERIIITVYLEELPKVCRDTILEHGLVNKTVPLSSILNILKRIQSNDEEDS